MPPDADPGVHFAEGWRIVAAHVSVIDESNEPLHS
jgi:hypothetical protein